MAVGRARAAQLRDEDRVVVSFFGDGATNQGAVHEAMVLAAMWLPPVVFVCENNQYSEMTPIGVTVHLENLADRAAAYPIPVAVVDGNDLAAVTEAASDAVETARSGGGPCFLEMKTFRRDGHYVGDPAKYVPQDVHDYWMARDPIELYRRRLLDEGFDPAVLEERERAVDDEIETAVESARAAPPADLDRFVSYVDELEARWS
jgi:pyruvate dehydrogenase E1 component alpha subunit